VPVYRSPEQAAIALSRAARYGSWKQRASAPAARPADIRRDEATAIVASALGQGGGWLAPDQVAALLGCYGLPIAEQRTVTTVQEAGQAAAAIGGTVVLKAIAPGLVHKSDQGAVALGLCGEQEVTQVAQALTRRL